VTGRNIPLVTSSTVWLFVEAINTDKPSTKVGHRVFAYAVRQARMTGLYHLEPGRVTTSSNANFVDALDLRAVISP
jgi:hypothetical protein